jgi:hypothetical protein
MGWVGLNGDWIVGGGSDSCMSIVYRLRGGQIRVPGYYVFPSRPKNYCVFRGIASGNQEVQNQSVVTVAEVILRCAEKGL